MKAILTAAVVLAVTLACAHTEARQEPVLQRRTAPELALTGCIVQGSGPAVFLLDKAKKDPSDAAEKAAKYFLSPAAPDINFRAHLNHVVRIAAEEDLKVSAMPVLEPSSPNAPRPGEERTLPRLIVKSVTMVSEKCP
jgi:hypothetical protein